MPTISSPATRKKNLLRCPAVHAPAKHEQLTDEEINNAIEDFLEDHVPPERLYKKSFLRSIQKATDEIKAGKVYPFRPDELLKI